MIETERLPVRVQITPPPAETLHQERILNTEKLAWLRALKVAQAAEQGRQL